MAATLFLTQWLPNGARSVTPPFATTRVRGAYPRDGSAGCGDRPGRSANLRVEGGRADMPPAKKRKPRARRSSPVAWPTLPALEQRQLDLVGLALVAAGIFFAGLIYLHGDGGDGGRWALDGLRTLIGAVHYGFPVALIAIGALVVLGPMLPAVRPFRAGGLCLFAALLIGLAAGTLGLGPGGSAVHWDAVWVRPRSGVVGEGLYWAISSVLGAVGAHFVAVFLFVAAALLLTGASIAGVVKATTDSVSSTTRDM